MVNEGCSQCSQCLCFSGVGKGGELLLLTGEESRGTETQMNALTCSWSHWWSVEITEIIAHIRRMPSHLKCLIGWEESHAQRHQSLINETTDVLFLWVHVQAEFHHGLS